MNNTPLSLPCIGNAWLFPLRGSGGFAAVYISPLLVFSPTSESNYKACTTATHLLLVKKHTTTAMQKIQEDQQRRKTQRAKGKEQKLIIHFAFCVLPFCTLLFALCYLLFSIVAISVMPSTNLSKSRSVV